jgi:hypothetical protein
MLKPKTLLILAAAAAAQQFLGGGFGGVQQMQAQGQLNRAQREQQSRETTKLDIAQDATKARDKTAKARYQNGCLMVVSGTDKAQLTAITEGLPVIDASRNTPLSVGNVVCDQNGLTGEIVANPTDAKTPVVGLTAFTADRAIVAAAIARYKGAKFSMPKQ